MDVLGEAKRKSLFCWVILDRFASPLRCILKLRSASEDTTFSVYRLAYARIWLIWSRRETAAFRAASAKS